MRPRLHSLVFLPAVLALLVVAPATTASGGTCGLSGSAQVCGDGTIDDDDVVIDGESSSGGSGGTGGPGSGSGSGSGFDDVESDGSGSRRHCKGSDTGPCAPPVEWGDERDDYEIVTVTLSDIARFRPSPGLQVMEPGGWAVVGLPVNVYAIAERQVVAGTLLGASAEVRFTPSAFRWDYGDGVVVTHAEPGASWADSGALEFDPTATSHVYRREGEYTIRMTLVHRAEYRIGDGPFVSIPGTLEVAANELHVSARSPRTVLVDRDCARSPAGPGC